MVRKILAFIAGFLTFMILVVVIQVINGLIFGMPTQDTMNDPVRMQAFVSAMPIGAFVGLLVSYIVGSFGSGFVMRKISRWDSLVLPILIGLIGTLGWAYTITQIAHPIWVTVVGFLCYLPFTLLGHRTAR